MKIVRALGMQLCVAGPGAAQPVWGGSDSFYLAKRSAGVCRAMRYWAADGEAELEALGLRSLAVICSITDGAAVDAAMQQRIETCGRIDIPANSAAARGGGSLQGTGVVGAMPSLGRAEATEAAAREAPHGARRGHSSSTGI